MSSWFKRKDKGIQTPTEEKKDVPKGLWYKTPSGKVVDADELKENHYVSPEDGYHVRVGSAEYFEILFDNNEFEELDKDMVSKDPLKFKDTKKYSDRLKEAKKKIQWALYKKHRTNYCLNRRTSVRIICNSFSMFWFKC